jgi:hypothetical protein
MMIDLVLGEVSLDGSVQSDQQMEASAPNALAGRGWEEGLDSVQTQSEGSNKVKPPGRVPLQPRLHFWMLVGGEVVHHSMDRLSRRDSAPTVLKERMNSLWWWQCMQRPITVPSSTFSAANNVVVPCRT